MEETIFSLSEAAQTQVLEYFKGNDIKPVRIFLNSGCGGSQLALAVDDPMPEDTVHKIGALTFIIDQSLLEKAQPITVDFGEHGFIIDSPLELSTGCGSCSASGKCGS